ncbi:MAG: alpha/beta hydrolase, partial [Chloroflexia bacterium]|nr:alpha/beta hydrolase [Chloroflexia bacterium]
GVAAVNPGVRLRNRLAPLLPLLSHLRQWVEVGEDEDLHDPGAHQRMYYYTRVPAMSAAEMYRLLRAAWKLAPHVDAPVLLLQSRQDGLLDPEGAEALLQRLRSEHKRLRWLETSGHNALVDVERSLVFDQVHDFIRQVVNRAE